MASATTWRSKTAAGLITVTLILAGCNGDDGDTPDLPETETESETEIPGVDAPEVEVDQ